MAGSLNRERLGRVFAQPVPSASEPPPLAERTAAVAVMLVEVDAALEVLLIERAQREGDPWSGHMALPGGHVDASDRDLAATAARETLEEVGVDLQRAGELLGRLSDYSPARGVPIGVRPFVYLLAARPALHLSDEVQEALWTPILPLQLGEQRTTFTFTRGGLAFDFPAWRVAGRVVWGLTYRVLDELFRRLNEVSSVE